MRKENEKKLKHNKKSAAAVINNLAKNNGKAVSFAAFATRPSQIYFETQDGDEKILLILRRHWVTNFSWILISFLGLLIPIILLPAISDLFFKQIPDNFKLFCVLFWYLAVFTFGFSNFIIWYFTAHIITDKRVVDIDFKSLTVKSIVSAEIEQIQDISYKQIGVTQSIFNFGDIMVQTAAERAPIIFEQVPKPAEVLDILEELVEGIEN